MTCRLTELKATHEGGKLALTGRLQGGPRGVGLVAHNNPQEIPGDYDAVGWTCPVDADGKFALVIGELKPGDFDLRLTAYGESGDSRSFSFRYRVDREKRPDLRPFTESVGMQEMHAAFRSGNKVRLAEIVSELKKQNHVDDLPSRKAEHLQKLLSLADPRPLAAVSLDDEDNRAVMPVLQAIVGGEAGPLAVETQDMAGRGVSIESGLEESSSHFEQATRLAFRKNLVPQRPAPADCC